MTSTTLTTIFLVGGALHAVATLAFLGVVAFAAGARTRETAVSATIVVGLTQTVYWAAAAGVGVVVDRGDGRPAYVSEWLGYAISLYFIGTSLSAFVRVRPHAGLSSGGIALALVGAAGAAGALTPSSSPGAQWALVAVAFAAYLLFFLSTVRDSRASRRRTTALLYFALVTLALYVAPFIAGPSLLNVVSVDVEHAAYVVGNVLTKIALPAVELYVDSRAAGV
jgi:hypothetical protein